MRSFTLSAMLIGLTSVLPATFATDEQTAQSSVKPAPSGVISGRVVDESGKPVARAKVNLFRYHFPTHRFGHLVPVQNPTFSDDSGQYQFENLADDYYIVDVKKTGFARALCDRSIEKAVANSKTDIVLQPSANVTIELTDESGNPVEGARIRHIYSRGKNGNVRIVQMFWKDLDISIPPSDKAGRLPLPPFASGDVLRVSIDHPRLAPILIKDLAVVEGATAKAVMTPGILLTLHRVATSEATKIPTAVIDLRSDKKETASEILQSELEFDETGTARIAIEPGDYNFLRLQHNDFYLTPTLTKNVTKPGENHPLHFEPGKNVELSFEVHSKVKVRGRVVDAETGKPVAGDSLLGEIVREDGDLFPEKTKMNFTDWAETDANGEFELTVAAGRARVGYHGDKRMTETEKIEFVAAPDGSTVIPDIKVRSLPKLVGTVRNPDGSPAARAVVRTRANWIGAANLAEPVLADEQGHFELKLEYLMTDNQTGQRRMECSILAFDACRPLAAKVDVRLDKPEPVVITLEPHEYDWPLTIFPEEMGDWQRGIVKPDRAAEDAKISLRGKPAPELDCAAWINTEKLDWAALRGKYVLLDFWFVKCGPCRAELPMVKIAHDLFKDKGLVVIGVHDNSEPPETVQRNANELDLRFPIAVDQSDGRTVSSFQKHGIATGFPNYVLIDPEGNVLLDDRTIAHPSMRSYKLEILRKYLFSKSDTATSAR